MNMILTRTQQMILQSAIDIRLPILKGMHDDPIDRNHANVCLTRIVVMNRLDAMIRVGSAIQLDKHEMRVLLSEIEIMVVSDDNCLRELDNLTRSLHRSLSWSS